ncbi:MAG TPA: SDR family oxidoreductase [Puia sp.]|jgi:short-subunit dehydrogenase|nr:SDR family oxidoreductase [Puia sp.]
MRFQNSHNVVITGASRGLGKAMAEKFAANNYDLYLTSFNEVVLYKALEELQTKFPNITIKAKAFDLSNKEQAIAFANWILDFKISIDILINNAGSFLPGNISEEEDGVLEKMIDTNLYSAYHITRALLPKMIKQNLSAHSRGHIFNICSIASLKAYQNGGSYSISKFALSGFSKNLREEMKPHGIKVTGVYPGAAYTDSWAAAGVDPKRLMEANDIADMVFAASQLSPQACVEEIILRPQLGDL